MSRLVLYGFDGSTFVRSVRMLLAEKNAEYEQVPVNVLAGEPHSPEHLARHPFGKVPVVDHGDLRLYETGAILRYLNEALPGPSFVPEGLRARARMDMTLGIVDSYGYGAMVGAVTAYHLFPDLVGGVSEDARQEGIQRANLVLAEIMRLRGDSPYIAGERPSLADFYLAPPSYYVSLTPDAGAVFDVEGFDDWWQRIQALPSYAGTEPDLG